MGKPNQTYEQEMLGNYLWSPKRKKDGSRHPFYESMREVSPGDLVLSFFGTRLSAVGIAQSHCYESLKPEEFGNVGEYWGRLGWKVDVQFRPLKNKIRPSNHISYLQPLLPTRYSPLQKTGRGMQNVYLTELSSQLVNALASLIGSEVATLINSSQISEAQMSYQSRAAKGLAEWEEYLQQQVRDDTQLEETEKMALTLSRRGQGKFKENVSRIEHKCRVTLVDRPEHLRASHIKPWRDSNNQERLDGENGLLLTPTIDHLFDRGFISFEDSGQLLISPVAYAPALQRMGIPTDLKTNVGSFTREQKNFLDYHRDSVFLKAHR